MTNSGVIANRWTRFLASHPQVPRGSLILQHFERGTITRLCDCGCNSFDISVQNAADLEPLMPPSERGGAILELSFYVQDERAQKPMVTFTVFADRNGYLAGVDVDYCVNSFPMPDALELIEPPYHVHGKLAGGSTE